MSSRGPQPWAKVSLLVPIIGGFWLLSASWRVLFIMVGFLLQWPTVLTLIMFPVLVVMYVRLAHKEETEVRAELGARWDAYAAHTPRWIPRLRAHSQDLQPH